MLDLDRLMPLRALRPLRVDACENEPFRCMSPPVPMMCTLRDGTSVLPDMVLPRPRSILSEWFVGYLWSPRYAGDGLAGTESGTGTG